MAAAPAASTSTLPWIIVAILAVLVALAAVFIATRGDGDGGGGNGIAEGAASDGAPVLAAETPVGPVVTKFVASTANIRNVPTAQGPDSRVVGTLRPGSQVAGQMVLGSGNAYWLRLSDGRGYVSAINLSDGPPVAASAVQSGYRVPVSDGIYCAVAVRSGNLRIRSSPGGRIVGAMPRGARFQAYGNSLIAAGYTWIQIQPADFRYPSGWVAVEHIICS